MSRPRTPEPALDVQGDSPTGTRNEDDADRTQHSHRMLNFSDALLSIIATVMVCGAVPRSLPCPAPTDPSHIQQTLTLLSCILGSPAPQAVVGMGGVALEKQSVPTQPRKWPQPLLSLFSQILPVTHTEISPEQVLEHSLQCLGSGSGSLSPNLGSTRGARTGGTALSPQPGLRTEAESLGAKAGAGAGPVQVGSR